MEEAKWIKELILGILTSATTAEEGVEDSDTFNLDAIEDEVRPIMDGNF